MGPNAAPKIGFWIGKNCIHNIAESIVGTELRYLLKGSSISDWHVSQELEATQRGLAEQLNEERQGKRSIDALMDHQRSLEEERELQAEIEAVRPSSSDLPCFPTLARPSRQFIQH